MSVGVSISLENIETEIKKIITKELDRIGVHYRLFSRVKDSYSLEKKIQSKSANHYSVDGKKVQDIIGFRVVTYFIDDVNILWNRFKTLFDVVDESCDNPKGNKFGVVKKNMVCRMNKTCSNTFEEFRKNSSSHILVDSTFEVQFRTTFSEGWHEVDHLLRYKCQSDWEGLDDENRMLDGVYAALETNDRALKALFDDVAYKHYKNRNYEGMIRQKFRMHFANSSLKIQTSVLNNGLAKDIIRFDRAFLLSQIAESGFDLPLQYDTIVYLIIAIKKKKDLYDIIPSLVMSRLKSVGIIQDQ